MPHPDLPAEQAYVDHAYTCLERMRARVGRALDAASGEFSALALEKWQAQTLRSYEDAERGIYFGRIDMDEGDTLYIGRRWILEVQGGPGTGKTAVGLHRASWLLFTHARRLRREGVLVVGPNRTFIEYVSHVLPSLGEASVVQRAIGDLREGTEPDGRDAPEVERRKGDAEMAERLRETVWSHRREPGENFEAMLGMNYIRVPLAR